MTVMLGVAACHSAPPPEDMDRAAIVADWAQIPEGAAWGQVSAVDTDSDGRVYVLQRGKRAWKEPFPDTPIADPTVYVFAANGVLLGRWGAGEMVMPYGLSIDPYDKVWITDVARQQVLRFDRNGTLEMVLGERGVAGDDAGHFGRPTDVGFSGDKVFVSDGYTNHRIAVFDRQGNFIAQWGENGSGRAGLKIPSSVAVADDTVYVADRENARIKLFGETGELLESWRVPGGGRPYAVKPLGAGWAVSVEGRDGHGRPGAVVRVWRPDGSVDRSFDASRRDGRSEANDLALARDGSVYLADLDGRRVTKLALTQDNAPQDGDGDE